MANTDNLQDAILKYDTFINDVLKEDLRNLESQLERANAEVADLYQQKHALKAVTDKEIHPTGFKTQVNLGCNFFMQASVPDTSKLLVDVGLHHYVELSVSEANLYLDTRIKHFEKVTKNVREKIAETKAHIKYMLSGLTELRNIGRKT